VEPRTLTAASDARQATRHRLRVAKFVDERAALDGEVFHVYWSPGEGLPAGAVVRLDYRQQRLKRSRRLELRYPFPVTRVRRAVFAVRDEAYRAGGAVTAWRVQVLSGRRVVGQACSAGWD
jgi:hypothetical protein